MVVYNIFKFFIFIIYTMFIRTLSKIRFEITFYTTLMSVKHLYKEYQDVSRIVIATMALKLYKMDLSPPARAAMMACDILNLSVEMIDVNVREKEHVTPEYLEKNPVHSVPMLEHGDLVITDSHAILMYLFDVYGKDDKFYPKDIRKRAIVNQRLFFDTAILFPRLRNISYPAIIEGVRTVTEKQLKDINEAYSFVEEYLSKSKYIAGDDMTIADISAYTDVTSLIIILPLDSKKYPKTQAWMNVMEKQSFSEKYNAPGIAIFEDVLKRYLDL